MKLILFFFSLFLSSALFAQTQMEMNYEAKDGYEKKDNELNKVYKKLTTLLGPGKDKELLIKAQRAWVSFRDAHCAFTEASYDGGSMQPLIFYTCLQKVTEQRIKQLKEEMEERNSK